MGVTFGNDTDREEVCRLLDRAVEGGEGPGATIVLENKPQAQRVVYGDTPLPGVRRGFPDLADPVPAKIAQMRKLYRYGEDTFRERCENFCRQGKFMEDYEDDEPWSGDYKRYFPTYHDLNVRQLRGYFTWRAQVRRGEYPPTATSFAYLYVYELLNGIGAASPEESLEKLEAFLEGVRALRGGGGLHGGEPAPVDAGAGGGEGPAPRRRCAPSPTPSSSPGTMPWPCFRTRKGRSLGSSFTPSCFSPPGSWGSPRCLPRTGAGERPSSGKSGRRP